MQGQKVNKSEWSWDTKEESKASNTDPFDWGNETAAV